MSSEGTPEGFDPHQEEIKWVVRKDGEPLDVHINRDDKGTIASSEFIIFSKDRESVFKVSFPGELPSDFESRLSAVGKFISDIFEHPENHIKFDLPNDVTVESPDVDFKSDGDKQ